MLHKLQLYRTQLIIPIGQVSIYHVQIAVIGRVTLIIVYSVHPPFIHTTTVRLLSNKFSFSNVFALIIVKEAPQDATGLKVKPENQ